jgi:hypothetical protein
MSEKRTIELEVKEQGLEQVTEKTRTLKQQLKEMKEQLATMDEGSQGFKELVAEAGKLQDKIGDLNQQVKNFSSDTGKVDVALGGLNAVSSGFDGVSGAMQIAGIEGVALQKAITKVQGAMQLANGVQQVQIALQKESALMKGVDAVKTTALSVATGVYTAVVGASTAGMKLFRLAMIGTGIGALVLGVGLLIANFEALMQPLQFIIQGLKDFGDFLGVTDNKGADNAEKAKKRSESTINQIKKEAEARSKNFENKNRIFTKEDDAMGRQIALMKSQGKDTTNLERARIKASIAYQKGLVNETYGIEQQLKAKNLLIVAELRASAERTGDYAAWNKFEKEMAEQRSANLKLNQDAVKALKDSENELAIFDQEQINKKRQASIDAQKEAKSNSESRKKEVVEVIDIKNQIEDAKLKALSDGQEKELELIRVQYERKKIDLEKQVKEGKVKKKQADELIKQDVILQEQDQQKIRDKYTQERIKKEDEDWLKQQEIDLSKQDYEKLVLMQKFDAESLLATDIEKLTTEHQEALKAIDAKYEAEAEAIKEAQRQKQLEAIKNYNLIVLSEEELARQAIDQKAVLDLEKLTSDFDLKLLTQEQYETAKIALTEKTNIEIAKLDEDAKNKKQELLNKQLDAVKGSLTSIANIAELFAGKSKASQKRAFNIQKASNIASATIDTFVSAQSAYKSVIGVPVVGPVLAPLASAGAIAMGLMNIKKIKESQFEGGAEPSASSGGGGGVGGAVQAPQFNVVGNNGMNQLAQLQQKPVQAYVVSSEMTSAQALERNRINNATI